MLADMVKKARHCVVYTGAGISTSAQLPDYRGPNGVYTKKGYLPEGTGVTLEQAVPTICHTHLADLLLRGLVQFIVSTNVDGLHRKSGVCGEMIAELHGNCFKEVCEECGLEYYREYAVSSHRKDHRTGRQCSCGGELLDTIVNFGEKLPSSEWLKAATHANKSDLALVLGTSMWVQPANLLPEMAKSHEEGGNMVIVNLQETLFDEEADLVIHGEIDTVMEMLMSLL
jgi:mono-ADP-ribosyltransferase sirtuin 6